MMTIIVLLSVLLSLYVQNLNAAYEADEARDLERRFDRARLDWESRNQFPYL